MSGRLPSVEQILRSDASMCELRLADVTPALANGLRRVILAHVPSFCIDEVSIPRNTSVLNDEFIAHRVGLLPLWSEAAVQSVPMPESECAECLAAAQENADRLERQREDHQGRRRSNGWDGGHNGAQQQRSACQPPLCPTCHIRFRLSVRNEHPFGSGRMIDVTSNDFRNVEGEEAEEGREAGGQDQLAARASVVPVGHGDPDRAITICRLKPGEAIEMEAFARKGTGAMHAKWSPVGTCTYRFETDIRLDPAREALLTAPERAALVNCCPKRVFDLEEGGSGAARVANPSACDMCGQCAKEAHVIAKAHHREARMDELISVREHLDRVCLKIESNGGLTPFAIFDHAIAVLERKLLDARASIAQARQPLSAA